MKRYIWVLCAALMAAACTDDAELQQILRGQPQAFRGLPGASRVFPEDAGRALGRNDRIIGVFHYQYTVAYPDTNRSAGTAFTNNHCDYRHFETEHITHTQRNRFTNMTLFRRNPGKCSGSVD